MVNKAHKAKKAKACMLRRFIYSALGMSIIGGAVAVLGAPNKW